MKLVFRITFNKRTSLREEGSRLRASTLHFSRQHGDLAETSRWNRQSL